VAIEEEAAGLEHVHQNKATSCMRSGRTWRRHQLLGSIHRWWCSALFRWFIWQIYTHINSLAAVYDRYLMRQVEALEHCCTDFWSCHEKIFRQQIKV
jgi:hypothetical protein